MTKGFLIYFDLCIKNRMFYVLNGFEISDFLVGSEIITFKKLISIMAITKKPI